MIASVESGHEHRNAVLKAVCVQLAVLGRSIGKSASPSPTKLYSLTL